MRISLTFGLIEQQRGGRMRPTRDEALEDCCVPRVGESVDDAHESATDVFLDLYLPSRNA